ncbi:hypothetical protein [Halobacterium wangiae]|uniref:hypothetical protein n=1 Tax=Halobacterium wangiae TaxID=2902623 RepID=UPI001E61BB07|nr:hypothetical protein [Halobacterium wangiae]
MVRSLASIRKGAVGSADGGSSAGDDSSSSLLRTVLLGVGLAGVVYVVVRKLRAGGRSADDSDDWYQLSIQESVGEASDAESGGADDADVTTAGAGADDELPGEERTDEEIEERATADVQEEPAEPGEMNVDEDVVDELVDDEENGEE